MGKQNVMLVTFSKLHTILFTVALLSLPVMVFYNNCTHIVVICLMYVLYKILQRQSKTMLPVTRKSVLITGCDTGFGHCLAKRLDDHGFTVFAGVLQEQGEGANELRSRQSTRLHVIELNVTREDDVERAVSYVNKMSRQTVLWGVVNNAGFYIPGTVELCTLSQYQRNADVNLYGYIRIIKAFLPFIRKTQGRIINISSVRGIYSCPGISAYNITKFGVEALSDALRMEMWKFGVKVCIVEPGVYDGATEMAGPLQTQRVKSELEEMWSVATDEVRDAYGRNYVEQIIDGLQNDKIAKVWVSPEPVLDAIEDGLLNAKPRRRYIVGGAGRPFDIYAVTARIYKFLPDWLGDIILSRLERL